MSKEEPPKKQNLGLIYFLLVILVVWNVFITTGLFDTSEKVDDFIKATPATPTLESLIDNDIYKWDCVTWYSTCQDLVFDNQTGYYTVRGYIDPTCDGMCAYQTLHKRRQLRTIDMKDLLI